MIDLGRETDGNNEICLGVRFALCIIKVLPVTNSVFSENLCLYTFHTL